MTRKIKCPRTCFAPFCKSIFSNEHRVSLRLPMRTSRNRPYIYICLCVRSVAGCFFPFFSPTEPGMSLRSAEISMYRSLSATMSSVRFRSFVFLLSRHIFPLRPRVSVISHCRQFKSPGTLLTSLDF